MAKTWDRETAAQWIRDRQFIAVDEDCEVVIDGDGRDLFEACDPNSSGMSPDDLNGLLAFVMNDYVKMFENDGSVDGDSNLP